MRLSVGLTEGQFLLTEAESDVSDAVADMPLKTHDISHTSMTMIMSHVN